MTRYDDIWQVLKDPRTFSSAQSTAVSAPPPREVLDVLKEGYPAVATLVTSDPPAHTRFRSLVNKAITPRRNCRKGRKRPTGRAHLCAVKSNIVVLSMAMGIEEMNDAAQLTERGLRQDVMSFEGDPAPVYNTP